VEIFDAAASACLQLKAVTRSEFGALQAQFSEPMTFPWTLIFIEM
jgi:hypothetical protein